MPENSSERVVTVLQLPHFRYQPEAAANGSLYDDDEQVCRCCGEARGWVYTGPVYAEEDLEEQLCPWCVADGSAHRRFGAVFVDPAAFGPEVPGAAVAEICERTPGYACWGVEAWPGCCGDAAAFVTAAGAAELRGERREFAAAAAEAARRAGVGEALDRDLGPTAYLFRCRHCGRVMAEVRAAPEE